MFMVLRCIILTFALSMLGFPVFAEDVPREQMKSLDEQLQDIKAETLSIGEQMHVLEEKLLYPSSTQVALFLSMSSAAKFNLDWVEIQVDGKAVTRHLYTPKELEALQKGGVQRIYTGNIRSGQHDLRVLLAGKNSGGADVRGKESFKFSKDAGPKTMEIHLVDSSAREITLRDW